MQININFSQTPVGTLLSEWLEDQGLPTQGVLLDGLRINASLMLAAQAQGKELSHSNETFSDDPLESLQIAPDLVSAP